MTIVNDQEETVIHSPHVNRLKLMEGKIKKEINKVDAFNLTFHLKNPAYGKMKPFKTLVNVYNLKEQRFEFEGRVLEPEEDMDSNGLHTFSYVCEGELAFLEDSQQRHLEFQGTPEELWISIINYHNSQVEDYKHFEPGVIEVTNSTNYLYCYLSAEEDTFSTIENELMDRLGGELQIRKENGIRYLDLVERVGESKETEIKIAKNLKTITRSIDPTEIVTRLTPLGTRIETEGAIDASEARLTIEEVNGGLPYLDRQDLIDEFDIQGGSQTWDDITDPNNLLTRAQQWMDNQKIALYQHKISAADLFLIGLDPDSFQVGNDHKVINPVMNIDERLRIIGKTIDILKPEDDNLTIGDKFKTLNEYQADANKQEKRIVRLQNTVNRQSERLASINEEYNNLSESLQQLNQAFEDADTDAMQDAINNLNQAVDDLSDAVNAIPDYEPATQTEDGLMSAADKTKLDELEKYDPATQTEDGLMSSADKAKLDLITVLNTIDLDQIAQKIADLEEEVYGSGS
ncbi:phage tail spike protein [Gracilibacillus saliphilus]|uniref:phage tail spike protein n=1 Tax=Gracilibacillus saliphilus TaxID=543890 RepID=UPI001EE1592F|nr:phage tail spike protein [Gracilibacillus saliphilus]